ncbi:MAG: hypothetical protein H6Q05_1035 [Acidobacteria bacterium]|jgi:hypothetical protein|nr:hypothetical protein [Acidobacteriota bacterium]
MSRDFHTVFLVALLTITPGFGQNYRGTYTMTSGDVTLTLTLDQDAAGRITGSLASTKGTRFRLEGVITEGVAQGTCAGDAGQSYFEAEFEESKLIFTLVEISAGGEGSSRSLEFTRSKGALAKGVPVPPAPAGERKPGLPAPAPQPASPSMPAQADSDLMRYFAGDYYSYSSGSTMYGGAGTERTVTLCPDGLYRDSYEFSASGTGSWGAVNNQRGAARWSIQGDRNRGVISVTYGSGQSKRIPYQVVSKDEGAILFDGIKFAFAGAPKCR